jgi:hypothetical protein
MLELPQQSARWDRQPGESGRQFSSFCAYRDLHPLDRSLAEVGRRLGFSQTYLERLSSRFQWVERTAAFDRHQDGIQQAWRARLVDEMNARHAEIAGAALQKVAERLSTMEPSSLRPADISRLLEIASRVERMARGGLVADPSSQRAYGVFNADEIRARLTAEGLLPDFGAVAPTKQ